MLEFLIFTIDLNNQWQQKDGSIKYKENKMSTNKSIDAKSHVLLTNSYK